VSGATSGGSGNSSSNTVKECAVTAANASVVQCQLPADLLPGSWQVRAADTCVWRRFCYA
jgi:hypothetical protein